LTLIYVKTFKTQIYFGFLDFLFIRLKWFPRRYQKLMRVIEECAIGFFDSEDDLDNDKDESEMKSDSDFLQFCDKDSDLQDKTNIAFVHSEDREVKIIRGKLVLRKIGFHVFGTVQRNRLPNCFFLMEKR
jgi:hypothetical protein